MQSDGDAAAHDHDHRLAVHDGQPILEVVHQVAGNPLNPVFGADHRFELRPLAFQLFLALDLFAFRSLFELWIDFRSFRFLQFELGEPALVIDRHGRSVHDRALNVVDADVLAEHGARVGVGFLDRCAGEADERRVRQRVAHVACEAVDEIVLTAVRLVRDYDNIASGRQHGVAVAPFLGKELLDRREYHAAGGDGKLGS